MKLNNKLINQLAAGKIVLKNEPNNPETALDIIVATGENRTWFDGQSPYYYKETSGMMYGCDRLDVLPKLPIIPISDFLLPEPRFKVGQTVCSLDEDWGGNYEIVSVEWVDCKYAPGWYCGLYGLTTCYHEDGLREVKQSGIIIESQTLCGTEKQFIVGKCYEFSDGEDWVKGKAVGTVDYEGQRNFIADIGGKLSVFENIRPIQPKEITKEALAGLLEQWEDYFMRHTLKVADPSYTESVNNLCRNTDNTLHQLKNNLITQK